MNKINLDDTIAAISTPIGEGGIGIARMSGKDSLAIADRIFLSRDGKKPSDYATYSTHYGYVVNPHPVSRDERRETRDDGRGTKGEIIDEVILTVMRSPRSYTREDVVEINCHGGIVPLRRILRLLVAEGARLANPGEFTMRAFLNGRIDLTQAEAVLDVIRAKTDESLKVALSQLGGTLSSEINEIRNRIIDTLVDLEASIDFPEEELELKENSRILSDIDKIGAQLKGLLDTADCGAIIRDGITSVISGRPNVGKSSLLNALARRDRAIVTPFPGTTRDAIEEGVNVDGIPLTLVDTAGITESDHPVEKEGIRRSRMYLSAADLVLLVFDGSSPLTREDEALLAQADAGKSIAVVNKVDLPQRIELSGIERAFGEKIVKISATQGLGLGELRQAIAKMVWDGRAMPSCGAVVTNVRHRDALRRALESIREAQSAIEKMASAEFLAVFLRDALDALGEIIGETLTGDILNRIFDKFCIGK